MNRILWAVSLSTVFIVLGVALFTTAGPTSLAASSTSGPDALDAQLQAPSTSQAGLIAPDRPWPVQQYLLFMARDPDDPPLATNEALFEHLAALRAHGLLQDFRPVSAFDAFLLQSPTPEALSQAATWPGVYLVAPVNAPAAREALESRRMARNSPRAPVADRPMPTANAPTGASGVGGLSTCTLYENGNWVNGSVITPSLSLTLTLKTGGAFKSQVSTVANSSGSFDAYFTDTIQAGDVVEVALPGEPLISINATPLSVQVNKATNVVQGTAGPNATVTIELYSSQVGVWSYAYPTTDGGGQFSADMTSQVDIFTGDYVNLAYTNPQGFVIRLNNQYVPGLRISPLLDTVAGYAAPGMVVTLTLKDNGGGVKATTAVLANEVGYFSADFRSNTVCGKIDIAVGDSVEMQYGVQPLVVVQAVNTTIAVNTATDVISGAAPANGKVRAYVYDDYNVRTAYKTVTADGFGAYTADFSGVLDILLGNYTSATYHDAQDNEVYGSNLYAAPYVHAYLTDWGELWVAAQPNELVTAMLKNALDVVKGTASGIAGRNGYLYLSYADSSGANVVPVAGDRVHVTFGSGLTRTVEFVGLDYVIDREARRVYGVGPANANLRMNYYGLGVGVATDASGYFSYTFSNLTGGYSFEIMYRNLEGNDIDVYGYVPQFTVYPDNDYLYGYGPPRQSAIVTVKDGSGATKRSTTLTTDGSGYYFAEFYDVGIAFRDTVVVDVGPLHYQQAVVTLTLNIDTANDVVSGAAPSRGWLNVGGSRTFGPYRASYSKNFYADYAGNYAAAWLGTDLRGGDMIYVRYWQNGTKDRVYIQRIANYAGVSHLDNRVFGYTTWGAVGTVTVRDSGGLIKASGAVTGSPASGYWNFAPKGLDIVVGDQISVQVGALNRAFAVIPMSGSLNTAADTVSGLGLPNNEMGVNAWHWRGASFSDSTDNGYMRQRVQTDAGGAFSANFQCQADLVRGDYAGLYYMDAQDVRHNISLYTTQPTVTVTGYPLAVQPGAPVQVQFAIADGVHPTSASVYWDTVSHESDNAYANSSPSQQGAIGQNIASFNAPASGVVYFKAYARVDGQPLWSAREYTVTVSANLATTLVDPVSGTTNDVTPKLRGVAPPNATVTLYESATPLGTTTADSSGWFTFTTSALAQGTHDLHATSQVASNTGPASNMVRLMISPTLVVDPVHILLTARGVTQHLRDASGYANLGGRIWTRTGDAVAVAIPISCTSVYTANLYVGGVLATSLLNSGGNLFVGTYTPPGSGSYAVDLRARCEGPSGPEYNVNLLTGLIDPDGYVYDVEQGSDQRIAGATVTCYELTDQATNTWQIWNGAIWEQMNPQTTGSDGYYSFFTLPGKYKVQVTAPGYAAYESPVLTVTSEPVHHNVGLRVPRYVFLPIVIR